MSNINRENLNKIIDEMSKKSGQPKREIEEILNSKSFDSVKNKMSPEKAAKLQEIISNREEAERLLQTPQARALMKKLLEEN